MQSLIKIQSFLMAMENCLLWVVGGGLLALRFILRLVAPES
jgi:hypothetical protein